MLTKSIVTPLLLLSAVLLSACENQSLTAPSRSPSPVQTPPVPVTDVYNITVRMTAAIGGECIGETMQSQMGVPNTYTLSVTRKDSTAADVTLRSTSGDYACSFPAKTESDGFTTFGVGGYYSCTTSEMVRNFACANGTLRDMQPFGQDISGHISGNEISGEWTVGWVVMSAGGGTYRDEIDVLETRSEYTGSR